MNRLVGGTALLAALAGVAVAGVALQSARADEPPRRTLLMVSGVDDHGQQELASVELLDRKGGIPAATVTDGTLVRVLATDGTWFRVASVEGPAAAGWVDDFRLRGVVHLFGDGPECRPSVGGEPVEAGVQASLVGMTSAGVQVALLSDPARPTVVPRAALRQLPPRGPADCGARSAADGHAH